MSTPKKAQQKKSTKRAAPRPKKTAKPAPKEIDFDDAEVQRKLGALAVRQARAGHLTPLNREDMLGLVALTEERIIQAIDSLGSDDPHAAALDLAKALASNRAIEGELENRLPGAEQAAVAS